MLNDQLNLKRIDTLALELRQKAQLLIQYKEDKKDLLL